MPVPYCTKQNSYPQLKSRVNILRAFLFACGFTSVITQMILLREFLKLSGGNELIAGMVMADWLFITGAGAYAGKFIRMKEGSMTMVLLLQSLLSILPLLTLIMTGPLREVLFTYGASPGPANSLLFSFILLLPFCFVSGLQFTFLSKALEDNSTVNSLGKAYFTDLAGSIAGGVIFNFVIIFFMKPIVAMSILSCLNIVACVIALIKLKNRVLNYIFSGILTIFIVFTFFFKQLITEQANPFRKQEVIASSDNYLGNITVTKSSGQYNFYENNTLLFSSNDVIPCEEAVHYVMPQHGPPHSVLLISGGVSGILDEILKYHPKKIDYIEMNPYLLRLGMEYINQDYGHPGLNIISRDPMLFLKKCKEKYDVVLINVPEPDNAMLNRYFTAEMFSLVRKVSDKNTVVSSSLPACNDYIDRNEIRMNSALYNTMKLFYANVIIINGQKNYFVASDKNIEYFTGDKTVAKGIETAYVNGYYLDSSSLCERSKAIEKKISKESDINTCFRPVSYYYQLCYYLDHFRTWSFIIPLIILALVVLMISSYNHIDLALFTTGLSVISAEMIIIVGFQVIYGYVFRIIGLIITVFMTGLAVGAYLPGRYIQPGRRSFILSQVLIALYFIIMPFVLIVMKDSTADRTMITALFIILSLPVSVLSGIQFSAGSYLREGDITEKAGKLYSSDMFGSAIGALMVTAFLLPLAGIFLSCMILACICMLSSFVSYLRTK